MPARSFTSISRMRFSRALEAHGAAQFFGLAAGEAGGDHRHAQQLLLKQRHAQRALQHRLERGMQAVRLFPALPALQIRMHHLADDGAGADDRDLHHDVVETLSGCMRGRQDICARLSTWNMPMVSAFCSACIDRGIVLRQMRQVDLFADSRRG